MSKSYSELMDETIASTINQKEDSESMKIDGKESNILYDTTEQALEGLKKGDFYNSLSHINQEIFNKKIQDAKEEVKKKEKKKKEKQRKKDKKKRRKEAEKESKKLLLPDGTWKAPVGGRKTRRRRKKKGKRKTKRRRKTKRKRNKKKRKTKRR